MDSYLLTLTRSLLFTIIPLLSAGGAFAQVVDFEDLDLTETGYWNGSDKAVSGKLGIYPGSFSSSGVDFANTYTISEYGGNTYLSWNGWAYSNTTDVTTAGLTNQYGAYVVDGSGEYAGSGNYGVYFEGFDVETTVTGIPAGTLRGAYFTNTTYAALSMLNGDSFAKKFGHTWNANTEAWDDTADPDWFLLTVTGLNNVGQPTGTVDFCLADYRFEDNAKDYIVSDWTWVDLSSLGDATQLQFALSSSDSSQQGMATPAYFAMDNLTLGLIPEPSALFLLLCGGLAGIACFGRRCTLRSW